MCTWFKRRKLKSLVTKLQKYQEMRENGDPKGRALELKALNEIIRFYQKEEYNSNFPMAKLQLFEYNRAAAGLNDAKAQLTCAKICFDIGRVYQEWTQSKEARPIHEKEMKEAFSRGFEFLHAAVENNYIEAVQYLGLVYIYGWGIPQDTQKGFQYILKSIEMANGWNRATKIIEKLGLNSQDFFKALTQYQAQNNRS